MDGRGWDRALAPKGINFPGAPPFLRREHSGNPEFYWLPRMKTPPWKLTPEELAQQQAEAEAQADAPIVASNGHPIDPKTGRFMKGAPGRPRGSRNKVTIACENLLEGEGES